MALSASVLATAIRSGMGFPPPNSTQIIGLATSIVDEIQNHAIVNNSSVTGTCVVAGPLASGASSGGVISGLDGSRLASAIQSSGGFPSVTTKLSTFSNQIVSHIMTGLVSFASGDITGLCTNTPISPGPLTNGSGANGVVSNLSGSTLASNIHSAEGFPGSPSSQLIALCNAITNHIMANGVASYQSGMITGTCPAGPGPLVAGSGSNGKIN